MEYCSRGTYPNPKTGYPGFWRFEYGIRYVGEILKSLEDRGYIIFGSVKDSLNQLTVAQLKDLLVTNGLPNYGKKTELIERVSNNVSEDVLLEIGVQSKYKLTEKGQRELSENAYVPYMHSYPYKTTEDERYGLTFNVWIINKLLGTGDKSNLKSVVDEQEQKMKQEKSEKYKKSLEVIHRINPEGYKKIIDQDEQITLIKEAKAKYDEGKNLGLYIKFWEDLWNNGGLKFEGTHWTFELADLYIKAKRYDEAMAFVSELKIKKTNYVNKSYSYIKKIEELKKKINKA